MHNMTVFYIGLLFLAHITMFMAVWRGCSALVLINEVNLRRVRLVLGWVTVSRFDSRGGTLFPYVTSTQVDSAFYLRGTVK